MKSTIIIEPSDLAELTQTERPQSLDRGHCFICGTPLSLKEANETDRARGKFTKEHIFPKWMLKQAEIYDTNNTYYDGQLIQYNRITIPCCMQCNSIDYAQLESEIRNAFTIGYEDVIKLQTATLFTWLCKIHYGLRFFEATQKYYDTNEKRNLPRISQHELRELEFEHLYLQVPSKYLGLGNSSSLPGSIHIYKCMKSNEHVALNFDYCEIQNSRTIGLRFNDVGIIAFLDDFGFTSHTTPEFLKLNKGFQLHPTQFRELYARAALFAECVTHTGRLELSRSNSYLTITPHLVGTLIHQQSVDLIHLTRFLQQLWHCTASDIYNAKDNTILSTLIHNGRPSIQYKDIMTLIPTRTDSRKYLWPFHKVNYSTNTD